MTPEKIDPKLMLLERCPLCHGEARKKLYELERYGVYQCSGCGLRYIDPCLSPEGMQYYYSSEEKLLELNPFHQSYYEYGDPMAASKTVKDFERTLERLEKDIPQESRTIFDVGCGNGLFLAVAKRRGWTVAGCDSSESNVAQAKAKFGLDIYRASFDAFDPTGKKYTVIAFWDVLEHLVEPHAVLEKAISMLGPQGRIVIGGPNDKSFLRVMASVLYKMTGGRIQGPLSKAYLLEHTTYYTIETLQKLFGSHGFVSQCAFLSSTDLAKFHFTAAERVLASVVLAVGKVLGLQNRLIAIFKPRA